LPRLEILVPAPASLDDQLHRLEHRLDVQRRHINELLRRIQELERQRVSN